MTDYVNVYRHSISDHDTLARAQNLYANRLSDMDRAQFLWQTLSLAMNVKVKHPCDSMGSVLNSDNVYNAIVDFIDELPGMVQNYCNGHIASTSEKIMDEAISALENIMVFLDKTTKDGSTIRKII